MENHLCFFDMSCICYTLALEPDENCPIHGYPSYSNKCSECGRFFKKENEKLELGDAKCQRR